MAKPTQRCDAFWKLVIVGCLVGWLGVLRLVVMGPLTNSEVPGDRPILEGECAMNSDGACQVTDVDNKPVEPENPSEAATTAPTPAMVDVMDEIALHFTAGQEAHPGPHSNDLNLANIRDRMTKLESAFGSTSDPDHLAGIRRRALQLAGLCVRLVMDGDLPSSTPS